LDARRSEKAEPNWPHLLALWKRYAALFRLLRPELLVRPELVLRPELLLRDEDEEPRPDEPLLLEEPRPDEMLRTEALLPELPL
jgi:hypothetical protein